MEGSEVDPMAHCKIGDKVKVQFNDAGQYFDAVIRTMDYGAESLTVRWDFNNDYCLFIDRTACNKRFWHVKTADLENCAATPAQGTGDNVNFWLTTTPGPFSDLEIARPMEIDANVVPIVMDVAVVVISLMVSLFLSCTGYKVYNNFIRKRQEKLANAEKIREEKAEKKRKEKLRKKLIEANENVDLKSEDSFLGALGISPMIPKNNNNEKNKAAYEPESEPGAKNIHKGYKQMERPKSAPNCGKFGRYYLDPNKKKLVEAPWRRDDSPVQKLPRPTTALPRRNAAELMELKREWRMTREWGAKGIPRYPMHVNRRIKPPKLEKWHWLKDKIETLEESYDPDEMFLKVQKMKNAGDEEVEKGIVQEVSVDNETKTYVENFRNEECAFKKDREDIKKVNGPFLSRAIRNQRFDLYRPELQKLMLRADRSKTKQLLHKEVDTQEFRNHEVSAVGPEKFLPIERAPPPEFTLKPKSLKWVPYAESSEESVYEDYGAGEISSSDSDSATEPEECEEQQLPAGPARLPPLPTLNRLNGPKLSGKSPYEMMRQGPRAADILIQTVGNKTSSPSNKSSARRYKSSRNSSHSPPPLSARVKAKTAAKVEQRLDETRSLTKPIRERTHDQPVVDDPESNIYLGMQVRDDDRERRIEEKAAKRHEKYYNRAVITEINDHHVRDNERALRPALQSVLHSAHNERGSNSIVSETGQFARNTAAYTLLSGPKPKKYEEQVTDEQYAKVEQAFLEPTVPMVPVSPSFTNRMETRKGPRKSVGFGSATFHAIREKNSVSAISVVDDNESRRPDHVEIEIAVPDNEPSPKFSCVSSKTLLEPSLGLFGPGSRIHSSRMQQQTSQKKKQPSDGLNLPGMLP